MISNAVRCVPPQNKPTPAEIAECRGFLSARMPPCPISVIVVLGRVAHDQRSDDARACASPRFPSRTARATSCLPTCTFSTACIARASTPTRGA